MRALRSRALHFAVSGAVIFTLAPRPQDPSKVALRSSDLQALRVAQAGRVGAAALTPGQAEEVDERALEDEILYREALRLGLDREDAIVRQHLIQKTLLLAEDMAGATRTPSDDDLHAYYEANRGQWTKGTKVHFIHVFVARHDRVGALDEVSTEVGKAPPMLGDAFPSSRDVSLEQGGIAAVYGDTFANAVVAQPVGSWGPAIESKFGWHRVKVLHMEPGRPASFEEVRSRLPLEWSVDQRHKAIAGFLSRARQRYDVTIDGQRAAALAPLARLARRLDPSGED